MIDNLFKARSSESLESKWVEGNLVQYKGHGVEFVTAIQVLSEKKEVVSVQPVRPKTVCRFTGLFDKDGVKGFFGDVWRIKDFRYDVKWGEGFVTKKTDLRFYLVEHPLEIKYVLLGAPEDLTRINLRTIFNLPLENGERMFVDDNRKKLEIIGNIHH